MFDLNSLIIWLSSKIVSVITLLVLGFVVLFFAVKMRDMYLKFKNGGSL